MFRAFGSVPCLGSPLANTSLRLSLTKFQLQNGRLAMLAISGLMVQEQLTGKGAIEMLGL